MEDNIIEGTIGGIRYKTGLMLGQNNKAEVFISIKDFTHNLTLFSLNKISEIQNFHDLIHRILSQYHKANPQTPEPKVTVKPGAKKANGDIPDAIPVGFGLIEDMRRMRSDMKGVHDNIKSISRVVGLEKNFLEAMNNLSHVLEQKIKLEALKTELKGMEVKNKEHEARDESLAYGEGAFADMADRMAELLKE